MKLMYDPDHDKIIVETDTKLPFEVTDKEAEIIAIRNISLAMDNIAKALLTIADRLDRLTR